MRILIVEDEIHLAEALGQIMAERKYLVDIVHDGADGLDYALTGQYDAILLDVMLPKIDGFEIARRLRAAHVSTPHLGTDALYMASQLVVGLQALVTRRTSPVDPLVIGVGKLTAGTAYNIVAETAVLEGTVRAMTAETRKNAQEWLTDLCTRTAQLYGGAATVEWTDYATPLVNPALGCEEVGRVVTDLFGPQALVADRPISLGGDDFAEFLLTVPGCYAYVGSRGEDPHTQYPLHNGHVDMDEGALSIAAALHAEYTWRYLTGEFG